MREIKFKAVLFGDKNRIVNVDQINFNEGPSISFEGSYHVTQDECRFKLLQYTGLKDKSGKEIYDGYVVEYFDYSNTKQIGKVVYRMPSYFFEAIFGDEEGNQDIQPYLPDSKHYRIIGNIYENPDLLEVKE